MRLQRQTFRARAFRSASRLSDAVAAWPNHLVPPPFRLVQIGSAFWQSRALATAAELDLATLLGDGTMSVAELAVLAGAEPDALARLLRLLAAMGVFTQTAAGAWRNNRLSQPLRTDRPGCVRAMVLLHNAPAMSRPWYEQLTDGIRHGETPFERMHGQSLYQYLDHQPALAALFAQAMDQVEALTGDSFATSLDWGRFTRLIDVGGSQGGKAAAILRRHPGLRALVLDRPDVIAQAEAFWKSRNADPVRERIGFGPADVLQSVPAATDGREVFLLAAVLHGMDDATAAQALRNVVRAAGPVGARIVLLELVLPERGASVAEASFDLQLFMGTRGRERTMAEWLQLLHASGATLEEAVPLASFGSLLVLRPG